MPHCPSFMFDVASARAAAEFLSSEIGLEAYSQKYSVALLEVYEDVTSADIGVAAEGMLQFLADIEAGENAVNLLYSFTYYRIYFEGPTAQERSSQCLEPLKTQ